MGRGELLVELADTHESLARLHIDVAYFRSQGDKAEVTQREAIREAYDEKKWLLVKLIDNIED